MIERKNGKKEKIGEKMKIRSFDRTKKGEGREYGREKNVSGATNYLSLRIGGKIRGKSWAKDIKYPRLSHFL